MAKYVNAADLSDPSLVIAEAHAASATVFVDAALRERGIDPDSIALPNALLTEIASHWTKSLAANEGAIAQGEGSPLIAKAQQFQTYAKLLEARLSKEALGLSIPAGAGFGSVVLGRA